MEHNNPVCIFSFVSMGIPSYGCWNSGQAVYDGPSTLLMDRRRRKDREGQSLWMVACRLLSAMTVATTTFNEILSRFICYAFYVCVYQLYHMLMDSEEGGYCIQVMTVVCALGPGVEC